jgi:hypothetical protein
MALTDAQAAKVQTDRERIAAQREDSVRDASAKEAAARASLAKALYGEGLDAFAEDAKNQTDRFKSANDAIARFRTGVATSNIREIVPALVKMRELAITGPVEAGKIGEPNRIVLSTVDQTVASNPELSSGGNTVARNKAAWRTFYQNMGSEAGGNWTATTQYMNEKYGPDPLAEEELGAGLIVNRRALQDKLAAEKRTLENIQATQVAFSDLSEEAEEIVHTGQPIDDALMQKWQAQLQKALPGTPDYIRHLEERVKSEETDYKPGGSIDNIRDPALRAKAERAFGLAENMVAGEAGKASAPDVRLAGWVAKPNARWWAQENGFKVGQVVPVTSEEEKEALLKKHSDATLTKYGVYLPGPDDEKAARMALRQRRGNPRKNVFRAAGIGRGAGTDQGRTKELVEIRLAGPAGTPAVRAEAVGTYAEGAKSTTLVRLSDGSYIASPDGTTWSPLDAAAASKIVAQRGVEMEPVPEGTDVDIPEAYKAPEGRAREVVRGVVVSPVYGDPTGSRRVRTEDGRERLIKAEEIDTVTSLAGGQRRTTAAEVVGRIADAGIHKKGQRIAPVDEDGEVPTYDPKHSGPAKKAGLDRRAETERVTPDIRDVPEQRDAGGREPIRPVTAARPRDVAAPVEGNLGGPLTPPKPEPPAPETAKRKLLTKVARPDMPVASPAGEDVGKAERLSPPPAKPAAAPLVFEDEVVPKPTAPAATTTSVPTASTARKKLFAGK